ncbi:hypothetical protein [Pseudoxanthomonas sp.]|uniref:hypothetical protein n=1 Tax=Pseudoxanthomonas sp. TaxID=1871049 RepID=UPI0026254505|nr:hypothetical protein [Pseudoxanthomonas sp.]WDS37454.1 MAG: hypothetical protein O8I58_06150 [Pseudoxanthomonas sp.]
MPNVTFFIQVENMPPSNVLAELTAHCTRLCTGILNAALENVHIIHVAAHQGRGHPIFAEIKYRLDPLRTRQVMEDFMEKLDEAIHRETGLTARIRCFGYAPPSIHARN